MCSRTNRDTALWRCLDSCGRTRPIHTIQCFQNVSICSKQIFFSEFFRLFLNFFDFFKKSDSIFASFFPTFKPYFEKNRSDLEIQIFTWYKKPHVGDLHVSAITSLNFRKIYRVAYIGPYVQKPKRCWRSLVPLRSKQGTLQ